MKKIISSVLLILLVACLITPVAAFAEPAKNNSVGGKALKGTANVLLCWTEVVQSPAEGVRDHGPLGFISGLVLIIPKVVVRAVGGAADIITSPVPEKSLVDSYPLADL